MMKWWGWGDPKLSFPMQEKPTLWPWIQKKLGVTENRAFVHPVDFSKIKLNPSRLPDSFKKDLLAFLKPDQLTVDDLERVLHSYGKSFPDLWRVRNGIVRRAPDLIVLPHSHEEVEKIMALAKQYGVCLIPFGGGTNIVGGVNPEHEDQRSVVTLDLRNMNRVLHLDPESRTATIQGGALGPKLEADLLARGHSLGHYPDSFEYSTLGGWLATRSAGMQSDAYGKIEDMVVSIKVVTPEGTIVTKAVPASSAGPNLNQLLVGSEGILGVITEATMRIHRSPAVKDYRGFLFRTFEDGVNAIQECIDRDFQPSMIRLQDSCETELALNMKAPKQGLEAFVQKLVKVYLKRSGYTAPCILIVGFEGDEDSIAYTRKKTLGIMKSHGGFSLGASVGKTWSKDKFNVPYLRDYVMDYGCMADVAETAALWKNVVPLYYGAMKSITDLFKAHSGGYVGCHISHTYKTGACLYFTFGAKLPVGRELEHYYEFKRGITNAILKAGGTLSHHHAIGTEHRPWMTQEISPTGLKALHALKNALDPQGLLNPGKLLPELTDVVSAAESFPASHLFFESPGRGVEKVETPSLL